MKKAMLLVMAFFAISTLKAEGWLTDFDQARQEAANSHKNILILFQGSDWCSVCMRLDKEIIGQEQFLEKARKEYVLLKVDFPRKKANALPKEQQEKNNHLAETYNQSGYFPLVVITDEKGEIIGKTGYKKMSPDEYFDHLTSLSQSH